MSALLSAAMGEHLSHRAVLGIAVTVSGVILVSVPAGGRGQIKERLQSSGLGWAIASAIAYGVGLWLQGTFAVPTLGALVPVWLSYGIAVGLIALLRRTLKVGLGAPNRRQLAPVLGAGLCSATAYVALTLGFATGHVAIAVVLSTLNSAVTVLLSMLLDGARVAKHQWLAMAVISGGLILVRS